jgi:hypothetical protein
VNIPGLPRSPCNRCKCVFSSMSAFDQHQTVKHRKTDGMITCKKPAECGLVCYPGGIWDWPLAKIWKKMWSHPDDAAALAALLKTGYWGIYAAVHFAENGPLRVIRTGCGIGQASPEKN